MVKQYVVPAVSYAICVWYPFLLAEPGQKQLKSLRYGFYACFTYCCFEGRETLGWCNSTRSMAAGTSIEEKLVSLTGIPSLEHLYMASCIAHHDQVRRMVELGWLDGVVKQLKRNKKLVYCGKTLTKRVSPLKLLLSVVFSIKRTDICTVKKMLKPDSVLKLVEVDNKTFDPLEIRRFQRVLSLHVLDRWECPISRKRLSEDDLKFYEENSRTVTRYKRMAVRHSKLMEPLVHDLGFPSSSDFKKVLFK